MKTVVLLSGGMDSTVLTYHLLNLGHELKAISFLYGQKHARELDCARAIAEGLNLDHRIVDLSLLQPLFGQSALTDTNVAVPDGHYAADTMKATIVPNRNMIFLSIASAWAISSEFDGVAFAAHAGDHYIYPDCRPAFIESLRNAIREGDAEDISLLTPFVDWDKGRICARGSELNVPFASTWSCYKGKVKHCGLCGTCVERKEAFLRAEIIDPTEYES